MSLTCAKLSFKKSSEKHLLKAYASDHLGACTACTECPLLKDQEADKKYLCAEILNYLRPRYYVAGVIPFVSRSLIRSASVRGLNKDRCSPQTVVRHLLASGGDDVVIFLMQTPLTKRRRSRLCTGTRLYFRCSNSWKISQLPVGDLLFSLFIFSGRKGLTVTKYELFMLTLIFLNLNSKLAQNSILPGVS